MDLSAATGLIAIAGEERRFTQAVSRWAYERDYQGIVYSSRLHLRFTCWAVFESATIQRVGAPETITPNDRDFLRIARSLSLRIEPDRPAAD